MSYRTHRPAESRKILLLALQEFLFVIAWAALAGALFLPVTNLWIYLTIPAALIAVHFLTSMEISDETSLLVSLSLRQISSGAKNTPSRKAVFFRILLSVLLFPAALIGYIPLMFGKPSLPELLSGTRLTAIDIRFDPRHPSAINSIARKAGVRVRTLTIVPLAAAAAAFILLHSTPVVLSQSTEVVENGLPESEQELLTHYLSLTAIHPEELEYHVRLASLYQRNDMQQDLANELEIIAGIDSTHAIMILADTTGFTFEMLTPAPEDSSTQIETTIVPEALNAASADSTSADSTAADSTSLILNDSLEVLVDSVVTDTTVSLSPDTLITIPDTLPEVVPDIETETDTLQTVLPDTAEVLPPMEDFTTPAVEEIQETEEETVGPDTLVQP